MKDLPQEAYARKHVEVHLDVPQAFALRRAFEGLRDRGAKLANDRFVSTEPDAIRWMLENLHVALKRQTGV
jgi:hypothetical protein